MLTTDRRPVRMFIFIDLDTRMRIAVADSLNFRAGFVSDFITGLLAPAIHGLTTLSLLVRLGIRRGLRPLERAAPALEAREPNDFSLLPADPMASELRLVTEAVNGLFARLSGARDRERHFIASAAHKLQTPLAGLKARARIATIRQDRCHIRRLGGLKSSPGAC